MIVTLTINPALDKTTSVDKLLPEKKLRCDAMSVEAGGGGINVSKAIIELGGKTTAVFTSGGMNGRAIEAYLEQRSIPFETVAIEQETRESVTVLEKVSNNQFRFVMPGPTIREKEVQKCLDMLEKLRPDILVASGSLAPGLGEDFLARVSGICKGCDTKFIADTSGKPLQAVVESGVYLLKPNLHELSTLAGVEELQMDMVDDAAQEVIAKGKVQVIVVSMGQSGAMLVTKDIVATIPAPIVRKKSTVGAGDSMVGGMAYKIDAGADVVEMAMFGVACGTAATMNAGSQLFKKPDVERLYAWIKGKVEQRG